MNKKDYAIIFERGEIDQEKGYTLRAIDYVEGEEKIVKGGVKVFVIDEDFKKDYVDEIEKDPFYDFLFQGTNKIKFMGDLFSLDSKYVYGSTSSIKQLNAILDYNYELEGEKFAFDDNNEEHKEAKYSNLQVLKELYVEALRNYDFYQGISESTNELVTYCERKEPLFIRIQHNELSEEILETECGLSVPYEEEIKHSKSTFKELPKKIDVKKIYEECKKYIIGQDEHILPILCAINDNLTANIPEEKTNMLICGNTGVGKTAIFKRISEMIDVPIIIENATQFTQAGYVGRDVDDIFEDLINNANGDIELAQHGIIIIDEIDKKTGGGDRISGVGVIHSLLKLLEGGDYAYEVGTGFSRILKSFNTLNTTIAFSGSFLGLDSMVNKKSIGFGADNTKQVREIFSVENLQAYGIPPEFIGRLSLLEKLNELSEENLKEILINAKVNPLQLFADKMKRYNTKVLTDEVFIDAVAKEAYNRKTGARGLYSIMKDATKIAQAEAQLSGDYHKELILTPDCINDSNAYTLKRIYKRRATK